MIIYAIKKICKNQNMCSALITKKTGYHARENIFIIFLITFSPGNQLCKYNQKNHFSQIRIIENFVYKILSFKTAFQ